ncbi:peptidase-like protein [Deinococcus phoenicis]|uniref:Peptidase-like protein n=1 Tax=Deinococcus phoenicis TaxID=1476583 RepID=A0A016QN06_9DEIO|nr:Ig-like domain-containing protein [Deinococcus phoenicis]EYB67381.1 peptidase-like protein [Deinococcus phoenicis]
MKAHRSLSLALLTGLLLSACGTGGTPKDTQAPQVALTVAPTSLTAAGQATFTATATDNVGVTAVEFYDGDKLIATDKEAPFTVSQNYAAADNGAHTIKAVAVDAAGNRGSASGTLTVNIQTAPSGDTEKPQVSLTVTPAELTANGTATFKATATDNVGVKSVAFYDGDQLLDTDTEAPYEYSQNYSAADNGTHTIRAVAVDAAGNQGEAAGTFTVKIQTTPGQDVEKPQVSLTATPQTLTAAGSVKLVATASDNVGVTKVTFYRGDTKIGEDTSAPYEATDNLTAANNGTVTYRAVAMDAAGNSATTTTTVTVNVPVTPPPADTTKPKVKVTAQPAQLLLPGQVTFTADVTDDRGVVRVDFYDNGRLVLADTAAPYAVSRTYGYADNGQHIITVRAYDQQGNMGETSLTFTVAIGEADALEPNDSIATPVSLNIGTPLQGTVFGQDRDFDYFKFDAEAGDMLKLTVKSVSVNPASTLDPYVMILMPDGKTVLEKDDDSGTGMESEIRFNVPQTGTYYVVVTSFDIHDEPDASDNKATNTYQIALTRR